MKAHMLGAVALFCFATPVGAVAQERAAEPVLNTHVRPAIGIQRMDQLIAGLDRSAGRNLDSARAADRARRLAVGGARDATALRSLESRLRCTCGCNHDLHQCRHVDFGCSIHPEMHRQTLALLQRGWSPDSIVRQFVDVYGEVVLMAPPKEGFNLVGYIAPVVALALGGSLLIAFLRGQRRSGQTYPSTPAAESATPDELARLEEELKRFDA